MLGMPGPLGTIVDLLAVMLGFGSIVFIHELGHFLAARWAGIRVLTFAVGFGPALVSFRKGIGFRRGSTHAEYSALKRDAERDRNADSQSDSIKRAESVSSTEYRLSALPFGGYVQMLGQDDLDPTAVSEDSDSYQNAPVWKRLVVISAGVIMNVILAAILFIIVFMAGLKVEPPIVGRVFEDAPSQAAEYLGDDPTISDGLAPGDYITSIDGHTPQRFDSVILKAAMAKAGTPLLVTVDRDGKSLDFSVTPTPSATSGLLDIGIYPQFSNEIIAFRAPADQASLIREFNRLGLEGLEPGDRIAAINGEATTSQLDIENAFENSNGSAAVLTVERLGSAREIAAAPVASLQTAKVRVSETESISYQHLLGLVPVMKVADHGEPRQGLQPGDIFQRIGAIEFPSYAAGIREIRARKGQPIELVVLRDSDDGSRTQHMISASVGRDGTVGFTPDTTANFTTLLAAPPAIITPLEGEPSAAPASSWLSRAGARILSINGTEVSNFQEIRTALSAGVNMSAADSGPTEVVVEYDFPHAAAASSPRSTSWTLDEAQAEVLATLGWESPIFSAYFTPTQSVLKADGPIDAISLGLDETKRVMASVYVTFLRLTQGSLPVDKINGPVGIAHMGTLIADRGIIWMLFFLGMISVNLAVVNFLPLPIVDGGQFLMLLYEGIRGKPVPVAVQSVIMTAGLVLIATVFLFVTFNDIKGLLGV